MNPYAKETYLTTTGGNEIAAIDFPGRTALTRLAVTRIGTGAITATLYSRAFTSAAAKINSIVAGAGGKTLLKMTDPMSVKVGDVIAVASSSVGGYNTAHRVTALPRADAPSNYGETLILTNQTYTAIGAGGTAALAIPAAEQSLYAVTAALTGSDAVASNFAPPVPFVNLDPVPNANIGVNRKIYLKLADTGTYRVNIAAITVNALN